MTAPLISSLLEPRSYSHPVDQVDLVETHISWVLLAGDYVYKIKKPVRLPFVDFSTLERRRFYCEEELRLNRRFAPELYLEVVAITGSVEAPTVGGEGSVLEYAVRMRRFPQAFLFDQLLVRNALSPATVERFAREVAAFHRRAPRTADHGGVPQLRVAIHENFASLRAHADDHRRQALHELFEWTEAALGRMNTTFSDRQRRGFVRECHGDLHLRNVVLVDNKPVMFDCIEFSEALRWIDVINEIAFVAMDLLDRGRPDLAARFVDTYLAQTGDYAGLAVLPFYIVYRALVRAKVHDLQATQLPPNSHERAPLQAAVDHYLATARSVVRTRKPALILMHGFSGSGKSRVASALVPAVGAICVRSDVERKRLSGLDATDDSRSPLNAGIYDAESDRRTYARLVHVARLVMAAGYPAVVDAAFLKRWQRELMYELASQVGIPALVVQCAADAATLHQRISVRSRERTDASEATAAVLNQQLAVSDPLDAAEPVHVVRCGMDGAEEEDVPACAARVRQLMATELA